MPPNSALHLNHRFFSRISISFLCIQILTVASILVSTSAARIPYNEHCSSEVPEATPTGLPAEIFFPLDHGYIIKGGEKLFSSDQASSSLFFQLQTRHLLETRSPDVFQINANLQLNSYESRRNFPRFGNYSRRRSRYLTTFELSGFWSASTGKLCMVGRSSYQQFNGNQLSLSAVLKLNCANTSNIATSLVNGTVESLDASDSENYFSSLSLVGYPYWYNYTYTLTDKAGEACSRLKVDEKEAPLVPSQSICMYMQSYLDGIQLQLDQNIVCPKKNCGFSGRFMSLNQIECSDGEKLHLQVGMSVNDTVSMRYRRSRMSGSTLVGEGLWDRKRNRLCILACPVIIDKASGNAYVGDCSIGFSLWFPSVVSLKNRSTIVGRIWSTKDQKDDGYFGVVSLKSSGGYSEVILPGLKYKYTELDKVNKNCDAKEHPKLENKMFPSALSTYDMRFDINVGDGSVNGSWGSARLTSVDGNFNQENVFLGYAPTASVPADMEQKVSKVSYQIVYGSGNFSQASIELYVEGIYNSEMGKLCMTGCRFVGANATDCEVLVNIQLAALTPEPGEHLTGTIRSMRAQTDPLYFKPLQVSSYGIYAVQAVGSIERMDIEIFIVLIMLTFSCICIAVQLFHVKKHPEVLPSMSILMLVILTIGHMIPLLLNFEAFFFRNQNKHNVLLSSGGWIEANEVIVRVITMVAFLLQFRLLQCAWSARTKEQLNESWWTAEKETLFVCLPLYLAGGFLAWFVHSKPTSSPLTGINSPSSEHSFWKDSTSFAGLVLDSFLLPQIILNVFMNLSSDKAPLNSFFYIGTTIVRVSPHIYDAYRARHYVPFLTSSYIYASPYDDFYSLAWDIIIPCLGVLFAVLIFLQQRYGSLHILPEKLRKLRGYEAVATMNS